MATKGGKGKVPKDGDKKGFRKSEECSPLEEKKEETPEVFTEASIEEDDVIFEEEPPPKQPTPEPIYEEPVLTQLIVESYEGEKAKGLYDGEGEVYYTGGHYYKGKFSEGMMHGRGVYIWTDGVAYEGDFTRNQVTGKGIYKWPDGSIYEGDVVNGLRHGYGIFRAKDNKMSYIGEWYMGKRHGKGRMEFDSEGISFYDGDWVQNIRHGWGTCHYASGNIYEGMWFNNIRHGEGSMRWLDRDQMYTGQWEDGIQHGQGQHVWFLRRVPGSQYPQRNMYDGDFFKGLRCGYGVFYYANGARFEGEWDDNMKNGKGKFIFKNGRIYEGIFENDHITEYPDFEMDGMATPDLTQIRTRTPLAVEAASVHSNDSKNTYGPSFQLEVDTLLAEFTETDREEEASQVIYVIMRHITQLRRIYSFYSQLGYEESTDNTYVMNRMQFWRFLKDCKFHHRGLTLMDMDRAIAKAARQSDSYEIHNLYGKILFREFLNHLVVLAFHIYQDEHEGTSPVLTGCLSRLISDNILQNACKVEGYIYYETRRAVNALHHMDAAYDVYQTCLSPRKCAPHEPVMKMRHFLFMAKDLKLVNSDLSPKAILDVLAADDPNVADGEGACNVELEMTFLEFFEALVGCAQVYVTEAVVKDPATPRPSTTMTQDPSMLSVPGSPFRGGSQAGLEDGVEETTQQGTTPHPAGTPEAGSPVARATSSGTHKTGDGSTKQPTEPQASNTTAASGSDGGHDTGRGTQPNSAKKSEVIPIDPKKSASFVSSQSNATDDPAALIQSVVSVGVGAQSEAPEDIQTEVVEEEEDFDEEDEELDEATRQFNFWTHQVHIFFVRKFFPAAEKMALLRQLVQQRYSTEAMKVSQEKSAPVTEEELSVERIVSQIKSEGLEQVPEDDEVEGEL